MNGSKCLQQTGGMRREGSSKQQLHWSTDLPQGIWNTVGTILGITSGGGLHFVARSQGCQIICQIQKSFHTVRVCLTLTHQGFSGSFWPAISGNGWDQIIKVIYPSKNTVERKVYVVVNSALGKIPGRISGFLTLVLLMLCGGVGRLCACLGSRQENTLLITYSV